MLVRPYTASDCDGVISLILPIQQHEFGLPVTLQAQPDLLDIAGFYQRGRGGFWVAVESGSIVGTIGLLDIEAGAGAIRKMFVRKDERGAAKGIAQRLLDALRQHCMQNEIERLYLGTTGHFHAAQRFYEKNAFFEISSEDLPPTFPVMEVDTIFYQSHPAFMQGRAC